jgi:hypothetical protein
MGMSVAQRVNLHPNLMLVAVDAFDYPTKKCDQVQKYPTAVRNKLGAPNKIDNRIGFSEYVAWRQSGSNVQRAILFRPAEESDPNLMDFAAAGTSVDSGSAHLLVASLHKALTWPQLDVRMVFLGYEPPYLKYAPCHDFYLTVLPAILESAPKASILGGGFTLGCVERVVKAFASSFNLTLHNEGCFWLVTRHKDILELKSMKSVPAVFVNESFQKIKVEFAAKMEQRAYEHSMDRKLDMSYHSLKPDQDAWLVYRGFSLLSRGYLRKHKPLFANLYYNFSGALSWGDSCMEWFDLLIRKSAGAAAIQGRRFVIVHVGVWLGFGVSHWLTAHPNAHVLGVDSFEGPSKTNPMFRPLPPRVKGKFKVNIEGALFRMGLAQYIIQQVTDDDRVVFKRHNLSEHGGSSERMIEKQLEELDTATSMEPDMLFFSKDPYDHVNSSTFLGEKCEAFFTRSLTAFFKRSPKGYAGGTEWPLYPCLQKAVRKFAMKKNLELIVMRKCAWVVASDLSWFSQRLMENRRTRKHVDFPLAPTGSPTIANVTEVTT